MQELFQKVFREINVQSLMNNTESMLNAELGQTFKDYHNSIKCAESLMKKAGIENVEIIEFPADGETVYQDKRMPIGWDATIGRLTIKKSPIAFEDPVVADFKKHPFHLIKGSVSTPKGGMDVRIITEAQIFSGETPRNALVMLEPFTAPRGTILKPILDLGAFGIISDFLTGRYDSPDSIQWVNACTEGCNWHVQADDRPFIGFSVSPRVGDQIRRAVNSGEVTARVECDGKRRKARLPMITGIIPGKSKLELWVLSHLFEPLADDNSSGVVASIEMARAIRKLSDSDAIPPLNYTLRLVFAMEFYGFAAYAEKMGPFLGDKTIGATNTDGMNIAADAPIKAYLAPPGAPFFGDYLMEILLNECISGKKPKMVGRGANDPPVRKPIVAINVHEEGMYADDTFLGDPTNGLPTQWILGAGKFWHNSIQTMNIIDPEIFRLSVALTGTWLASILSIDEKSATRLLSSSAAYAGKHIIDESEFVASEIHNAAELKTVIPSMEIEEHMMWRFNREKARIENFLKVVPSLNVSNEIERLRGNTAQLVSYLKNKASENGVLGENDTRAGKWFEYASSVVPSRKTIGFPFDQINVPKEKRRDLPDGVIYGPMARMLANMDGKKNLQQIIRHTEWECKTLLSDSQIKKYTDAIAFLAEYSYLSVDFKRNITKDDILESLRKIGIVEGDIVFVHSGLSSLGHIGGGADAVIDAFMDAVGKKGTLLFPSFTRPFIYFEDTCVRERRHRPHDPADPEQIWVGQIAQAFLKRKGVINSAHPTHSVAAYGLLARDFIAEHAENDPPTCKRSPFGKLVEYKAKIVYFGASLSSSTFLHFLEDEMNLPYLKNAVCRVKNPDGSARSVLTPKNLPGHRDFYNAKWRETKIFKKLLAYGMEIKETPLGLDAVRLISAEDFYNYGVRAIKEARNILLCDSPECFFCRSYSS